MSEVDAENKVFVDHDLVNEMIVVAGALVDEGVRKEYLGKVQPGQFQDRDNALLWEAMQRIVQAGQTVDPQSVHARVSGQVKIEYVNRLTATYPTPPANVSAHVSALLWDATRAQATKTSIPAFLRALKDHRTPPVQVKVAAEAVARSLDVKLDRSFMSNPSQLAASQAEDLRRRAAVACYDYGIPALDFADDGTRRMIPGAAPTKITLVTGVSGSAKSTVTAYIALQQAMRGRRVLYGAWEMGAGETLELMANISLVLKPEGGLSGSRYASSTGAYTPADIAVVHRRMEKIAQWVYFFDPPFHGDPDRSYSNDDALNELYRMVADAGCEVVVYDLWERCIPDNSPHAERRALFKQQQIHKRTNTHGLMVCQQKIKEVEKRPDKRPTRDLILGSSAWVDIADTILGVHCPALWKDVPNDTIETLVLKQRWGKWPVCVSHSWDPDRVTIEKGHEVPYEHMTAYGAGDGFLDKSPGR